jgi:hypothetical protein
MTATVITSPGARNLQGKFFVETKLDNNMYVIADSQGKMIVRLLSGSLAPGEAIALKEVGKDLVIEKMPGQGTAPVKPLPSDALEISAGPGGGKALPARAVDQPVIAEITGPKPLPFILPGPVAEGFYSLRSLEEVLVQRGLKGLDVADLGRALFSGKPAGAAAVLRIVNDGPDGGSLAIVVPFEKAVFELSHFVDGNLQSELWKAFSPDALGQVLKDRGSIPFDRLVDIDRVLREVEKNTAGQILAKPGESDPLPLAKNALTPILVQWLNVALDEKTPLNAAALVSKFNGASPIPALVEAIRNLGDRENIAFPKTFGENDFTLNGSALLATQEKQSVLPKVLYGLGINFERTLTTHDQSNDNGQAPLPSLKELLLRIAGSASDDPLAEAADNFNVKFSQALVATDRAPGKNSNIPLPMSDQVGIPKKDASIDFEKKWIATVRERMGDDFQKTLWQIKEAADHIEEEFPDISSALKKIVDDELSDRQNAEGPSAADPDKTLKRIIDAVETAFKALGASAQKPTEAPEHPAQSSDRAPAGDQSIALVKQQAGTVLEHIESLQVLAKQAPAAGGEQQLLVVPMKLDGRWTDVVIKMVKHRGAKAGRKKSAGLSVSINVSPTFLGDVSVGMDYVSKQDFRVSMRFEKDRARAWFKNNNEALVESFKRIGFSSPRINLQTEKNDRIRSTGLTAAGDTGAIDVLA